MVPTKKRRLDDTREVIISIDRGPRRVLVDPISSSVLALKEKCERLERENRRFRQRITALCNGISCFLQRQCSPTARNTESIDRMDLANQLLEAECEQITGECNLLNDVLLELDLKRRELHDTSSETVNSSILDTIEQLLQNEA